MRIFVFFLFSFVAFVSCKPSGSTGDDTGSSDNGEVSALEAQVMAIHDEVMPRINDMGKLSSQLRKIKSTLRETPEGKIEYPEGLDGAMESLKLAEQGMWDWMKAYSDRKSTLTEEQMKPFLEKQLELITKIKADMLASMEKAEAWLAAHPNQ